jgi:hypothetical protein
MILIVRNLGTAPEKSVRSSAGWKERFLLTLLESNAEDRVPSLHPPGIQVAGSLSIRLSNQEIRPYVPTDSDKSRLYVTHSIHGPLHVLAGKYGIILSQIGQRKYSSFPSYSAPHRSRQNQPFVNSCRSDSFPFGVCSFAIDGLAPECAAQQPS